MCLSDCADLYLHVYFCVFWLACPHPIISVCIMWMHVHVYTCACNRLGKIRDQKKKKLVREEAWKRKQTSGRKRESHFVCLFLSCCVPVQDRKLRGHWSSEKQQVSACLCLCVFLFPGVLLSHVSLSIWPAAREQWLMVKIRIETSLVGYRLSLSLSFSLSFCLCLFIFVFFLTLTLPHTLSFCLSLLFFTHVHLPISFLLEMYGFHILTYID